METKKEKLEKLEKKSRELELEKMGIEQEHKKNKAIIAKKKGEVCWRVRDLNCPYHPSAKFIRTKEIKGSSLFYPGINRRGRLWTYECEGCSREKEQLSFERIIIFEIGIVQKSKAYMCPFCGFVKGDYEKKDYSEIALLSGSAGVRFFCRICGMKIGEHQFMFS